MLKKRVIFTLLYNDGFFAQSRNFNLQNVGGLEWLKKNYDFRKISYYIDELIILDVSRKKKFSNQFVESIKLISKQCFIPITVGGGIRNLNQAKTLFLNACDKVCINSNLEKKLITQIANIYGQQSIVASLDFKKIKNDYYFFTNNGSIKKKESCQNYLRKILKLPVGEIVVNSIDRDGTGIGLDFDILKFFPKKIDKSLIISGGVGNFSHLYDGLKNNRIDAVNTANLLNFLGDGLKKTREMLIKKKLKLPTWNPKIIEDLNFSNQ